MIKQGIFIWQEPTRHGPSVQRPLKAKLPGAMMFLDQANQVWAWDAHTKKLIYYASVSEN